MELKGNVFHIQRFTIHDGPGLRTELFLKGCPLRCKWCSNPESWNKEVQLGVYRTKCISQKKCGGCLNICKTEALQFYRGKLAAIDYRKCENCYRCYQECPTEAIKKWGGWMSVEDCIKVIQKDRGYYERSGGGVTVSGGDPLLQSTFVAKLFKRCKEEQIHTCFESTFYGSWTAIEEILPYTDLIISDIKHMNSEKHKEYTGVGNEIILHNLKKLTEVNKDIILRIPVIPGINDDEENIKATADFIIHELKGRVRTLQLLSFMRLGEEKYKSLHIDYPMKDIKLNRKSFQNHVNKIAKYCNSRGIHCVVGTKERE